MTIKIVHTIYRYWKRRDNKFITANSKSMKVNKNGILPLCCLTDFPENNV